MNRLVCAVFDSASQLFGQPIFVVAKGQATRSFTDEVQKSAADNQLYLHPDDFDLYLLGEFDDVSGDLRALGRPELLVRGKDCAIKTNGGG